MSNKEAFFELCRDIELELMYRFGMLEEELRAVEEYFRIKHRYTDSASYKHGLRRLQEFKDRLMGTVR